MDYHHHVIQNNLYISEEKILISNKTIPQQKLHYLQFI
jgi:hypothetical protein